MIESGGVLLTSDRRAGHSAVSFRLSCQVSFRVLNPVLAPAKMSQTVSDASVARDQGAWQQLRQERGWATSTWGSGRSPRVSRCQAEGIRKMGLGMAEALVEV